VVRMRNRRDFLKTASTGLLTAGGIGIGSAQENAETIPITKSSGGIDNTAEVPKRWANRVRAAERTRQQLASDYLDKNNTPQQNGLEHIGTVMDGGEKFGRFSAPVIEVATKNKTRAFD